MTRDPMVTASPVTSSLRSSISPVCSPARTSMPRYSADLISSRPAVIARPGPSNDSERAVARPLDDPATVRLRTSPSAVVQRIDLASPLTVADGGHAFS